MRFGFRQKVLRQQLLLAFISFYIWAVQIRLPNPLVPVSLRRFLAIRECTYLCLFRSAARSPCLFRFLQILKEEAAGTKRSGTEMMRGWTLAGKFLTDHATARHGEPFE